MSVVLYHYTNDKGAEGILKSGAVRAENGQGDAHFGKGVYLTSLSPTSHNMKQIVDNNYDGSTWLQNRKLSKARVAFEFRIPKTKVKKVSEDDRDVWLFEGGNLSLESYGTKTIYAGSPSGSYAIWYLSD